jgi:aminoglycoside phosphotransferase family enzyme/predicted kinase
LQVCDFSLLTESSIKRIMELVQLIEALFNPGAYPFPVHGIEVRQTHISIVFLAGPFVYKLKKPVNLGFLDFSSLEKRKHFCEEEVRLNRRLAPTVYLGVVPITQTDKDVRIEGEGDAIEWAVKMERLPEGGSLLDRLERGELNRETIELLARKIAAFHARADSGPHIAEFGKFEVVSQNARENFEQSASHVGDSVSRNVFDRLRALTEENLQQFQALIESRASRGMPRDTHGDLHLDHVYYFPKRKPPNDLVVIDCIEFNERFRYADPIADAAFLAMDLIFHGERALANAFISAYLHSTGDVETANLLPFYVAYRAAIRGKVEGIELFEKEIPDDVRSVVRTRARAHWLLALGELEQPSRRPCLVLVGGLPGSGKSTLSRVLAEQGHFHVIRSDVVRKELAGLDPNSSARGAIDEGIYTSEWTMRTYSECLLRTERLIIEGERAIVDASFGAETHRREFLSAAARLAVPGVLFICKTNPDVARQRIENRRGDASDADQFIYKKAAERWQPTSPKTQPSCHEIATDGTKEAASMEVMGILRHMRLIE